MVAGADGDGGRPIEVEIGAIPQVGLYDAPAPDQRAILLISTFPLRTDPV